MGRGIIDWRNDLTRINKQKNKQPYSDRATEISVKASRGAGTNIFTLLCYTLGCFTPLKKFKTCNILTQKLIVYLSFFEISTTSGLEYFNSKHWILVRIWHVYFFKLGLAMDITALARTWETPQMLQMCLLKSILGFA